MLQTFRHVPFKSVTVRVMGVLTFLEGFGEGRQPRQKNVPNWSALARLRARFRSSLGKVWTFSCERYTLGATG